ncbi:MAG: hypothetical protein M1443_05540 [Nitrospirae bacterium]|nr:hypothetical protein [Nitrospirota bacterium]
MDEIKTINNKRKKIAIIIFSAIVLIGAATLYFYLSYKAAHITTDDAFVEGNIHTIASKVPGTVKMIYVKDNQPHRNCGHFCCQCCPRPYQGKPLFRHR